MNLLLSINSSDENYDADIYAAFVELTPKKAKQILKRMAAFKKAKVGEEDLYSATYWEYAVVYLSYRNVSDEAQEELTNNGVMRVTKKFKPGTDLEAELVQMVVTEDRIFFTCEPKYTSITISTTPIHLAMIREAAKAKSAR